MISKMLALGFDLATMPARLTWRSARAISMSPAEFQRFTEELRQASDEAAREIQAVIAGVDAEMQYKAGHLSGEQKAQAASLALQAAEQHLSMAAVNLLRALWLSSHASREIARDQNGVIIEHES
ncbi:hypothetical protein F0M18_07675 [Pseudohalioglobus sediminis]|uniref:Uncharacterized protein n=1 Tax=Pseudohalioglobus sediminis TaxID=2606449 RepID=A0A5B0WZQ8_9GAMM|nr:hypothetical protein [Pseudohalioglobus sediminis]KAA1192542.1 hypothetical protein F0M18_07675 [Pseudohalioglobus sediminis]